MTDIEPMLYLGRIRAQDLLYRSAQIPGSAFPLDVGELPQVRVHRSPRPLPNQVFPLLLDHKSIEQSCRGTWARWHARQQVRAPGSMRDTVERDWANAALRIS